jgi:predicted nucleic acid-binding protein
LILYQDSNSIVKRYLRDEHGITETAEVVAGAGMVATSLISYVEVRSALARARAGNRFRSQAEYTRAVASFVGDWRRLGRVEVSSSVVMSAGELAEKHSLRGADALHLAALLALAQRVDEDIEFSTWDKRLAAAAEAEGLSLAHEVTN